MLAELGRASSLSCSISSSRTRSPSSACSAAADGGAERRQPDMIRHRLASTMSRRSRSSSTTATRGHLVGIHAEPERRGGVRRGAAGAASRRPRDDHPQVRGRDRGDGPRRRGRRGDARAARRAWPAWRYHRRARRAAEEHIRSEGGVPTFKGYRGFPASICTSPNSMVVHGIPGPYRLEDGDLISVDVGVTLDGFVADSAYTFPVGEIDPRRSGCSIRPGGARRRDRGGAGRQPRRRHLGRGCSRRRRPGFLRRPGARRPRRRPLDARGAPDSELGGARPRAACWQPGMTLAIEPMITAGAPDV